MRLIKIFVMLLAMQFVLVGCGNKIPDTKYCFDLTRGKGFCNTVVTQQQSEMDKEEYSEFTKMSAKVHIEDVEDLILFFEKYCSRQKCELNKKLKKRLKAMAKKILIYRRDKVLGFERLESVR